MALLKLQLSVTGSKLLQVYVASMHLEPFENGSTIWQKQMEALQKAAGDPTTMPLILAGDTNMRDTEDGFFETALSLSDSWKVTEASDNTRYTWDTVDHGEWFNEYYGHKTRHYQRRYDRVYYRALPESSHRRRLV